MALADYASAFRDRPKLCVLLMFSFSMFIVMDFTLIITQIINMVTHYPNISAESYPNISTPVCSLVVLRKPDVILSICDCKNASLNFNDSIVLWNSNDLAITANILDQCFRTHSCFNFALESETCEWYAIDSFEPIKLCLNHNYEVVSSTIGDSLLILDKRETQLLYNILFNSCGE